MGKIGNWGKEIKFIVSDDKVLTFDGMKRDSSIKTSEHDLIGEKPKLEVTGTELEGVTFEMDLNAFLGVKPRKIEEKLRSAMKRNEIHPLVIGGKNIIGRAMLTKLSSAYDIVGRDGEIIKMRVSVTMTEYN